MPPGKAAGKGAAQGAGSAGSAPSEAGSLDNNTPTGPAVDGEQDVAAMWASMAAAAAGGPQADPARSGPSTVPIIRFPNDHDQR